MVSVSYSLTGQQDAKLYNVVVGTNAPGTGDVEIRINLAHVPTRKEANKLIEQIRRYINAGISANNFRI